MQDREERAAYEERKARREAEEFDAKYTRHQYRDASRTEYDSPLKRHDPGKPAKTSSLRHKKQIKPYDERRDSDKMTFEKVKRA